jgi:hypothetical protein
MSGDGAGDRPRAVTVRPGDRGHSAILVAVVASLFVIVAVLKPWGEPSNGSGSETARATPVATHVVPTSSSSAGAVASAETQPAAATSCLSSDAEQLVLFERSPGNEVRSWIAIDEAPIGEVPSADAPALPVFASHAVGIGICAATVARAGSDATIVPPSGLHAATLVDVVTFDSTGSGRAMNDHGRPSTIDNEPIGRDVVRLYRPDAGFVVPSPTSHASPPAGGAGPSARPIVPFANPSGGSSSGGYWPLARYAVGFTFASDAAGTIRWVRFDLLRGGGG